MAGARWGSETSQRGQTSRLKNIQPTPAGFVCVIGCDPERALRAHCHGV